MPGLSRLHVSSRFNDVLQCVYGTIRSVLQGTTWSHALDRNRYGAQQVHVSDRIRKELQCTSVLRAPALRPTLIRCRCASHGGGAYQQICYDVPAMCQSRLPLRQSLRRVPRPVQHPRWRPRHMGTSLARWRVAFAQQGEISKNDT